MRYSCIDRRRKQYPVRMMCRLLQVSHSGYYAWRVRSESQRAKTDRELTELIRQIHADSDGVYGAAKITAELNEQGYRCGRHKVARLMRLAGLKGCPKTTFKVTTQRDPKHPVADNLLKQDFTAEGPNERWASDITYIKTRQGWLYLAVVLDLVLASHCGLVDEPLDQSLPGHQCTEDGDRSTPAWRGAHPSLRPW